MKAYSPKEVHERAMRELAQWHEALKLHTSVQSPRRRTIHQPKGRSSGMATDYVTLQDGTEAIVRSLEILPGGRLLKRA